MAQQREKLMLQGLCWHTPSASVPVFWRATMDGLMEATRAATHICTAGHMNTGNDSLDQRFWRLLKKILMHGNGGLSFWWLKVQCFRICWCKCSKSTTTSAKALTAHRLRCCCMLSQPSSCHSDRRCTLTQLAPHGCS